jgi:hypothetical protein
LLLLPRAVELVLRVPAAAREVDGRLPVERRRLFRLLEADPMAA